MIQLLFSLLAAEVAVVVVLLFKMSFRKLAILSLDRLKRGRGPVMVKTVAATMLTVLSSSIYSMVKIQNRYEEIPSHADGSGSHEPPSPRGLFHGLFGLCVLLIYPVVVYVTYVPDWEFTVRNINSQDYGKVFTVVCRVRGKLDPPCNAVGYIERKVLGIIHVYQHPAWKRSKACTYDSPHEGPFRKDAPSWCQAPFDPEGILSSISSILSTIIGVHFGHVLVHMKNHLDRLKQWVAMGFALLILGIILHFTHAIPLNKQLYSFSYVCVTAGVAAIVFSTFYFLVDILGLRNLFLPLEWIGMNAMLVYVMAAAGIFEGFLNGWYYESTNNTLVYWVRKHVFVRVWHSTRIGILLYYIFAQILFWSLVAGILHRLGIYWKL